MTRNGHRCERARLLGCCSALALIAFGCGKNEPAPPGDALTLTIITPHNEAIRKEYEAAFRAYYKAKTGKTVTFRWQNHGTKECERVIASKFKAARAAGRSGAGIGIDIFFGGGVPVHEKLKQAGYLQPHRVPDDILAGVPKTIGGMPLYDPERYWYGTAVSRFGILFNKPGLANQRIPEPKTWADLARPEMYGWVVLADPTKSGSALACYQLMLVHRGWEAGLPLLLRIAGNAREFTASSTAVLASISSGEALAGMCIEFYARRLIATAGARTIGFVIPAASITPDPIAMIRGAPHPELAGAFIDYVLSFEGQRLLVLPAGSAGGPKHNTLQRYAVRPDVYRAYRGKLVVEQDPFEAVASGPSVDASVLKLYDRILPDLMEQACVKPSSFALLRQAVRALHEHPDNQAAAAEFAKLPYDRKSFFALASSYGDDPERARSLQREWAEFFRTKYETVIRLCR